MTTIIVLVSNIADDEDGEHYDRVVADVSIVLFGLAFVLNLFTVIASVNRELRSCSHNTECMPWQTILRRPVPRGKAKHAHCLR